jgi:tetratricopeptide (TPR) repeat protein
VGPARQRIQRFEIVAELGAGGMGTVYRARDPHLQREVAIKVLALRGSPPPGLSSVRTIDLRAPAASSEDLLAEARVMAQLSHPNLLPVFEVGLDGGEVFLVMELVEGANLRVWLKRDPLRVEVHRAFAQAATGLAAAHARGIVHRDFKPDNVLIGTDGRVRVADFGLSLLDHRGDALLQWGDPTGTPEYMAPEQLRGAPATPSSDVHAFACSLAEALTGVRYQSQNIDEWLRGAAVSPELRVLLRAGLDEDPEHRPDLAAFVAVLEGWPRPRRRGLVLAAAAAAGAIAVSGFAMTRDDGVIDCEAAHVAYGAPWDAARRGELVRVLGGDAGREVAELVDRRVAMLRDARHAVCVAHAEGKASQVETRASLSCLERRRVELGALVQRELVAAKPDPRRAGDSVFAIAADCQGHTDAELPPVPGPALAQLERFVAIATLPRSDRLAAHIGVERTAAALGERELEARAALAVAQNLRDGDQLKDAIVAFERAHRVASEIHATDVEVRALVENGNLSAMTGDIGGGRRLVDLALNLIDDPKISDWQRARALLAAGRVQMQSGDHKAALASFERGRAMLVHSGRVLAGLDILLRTDVLAEILHFPERRAEALALARDTEAYVKQLEGETANYALALDRLGRALEANDHVTEGIAYRKQSIAVYLKVLPANHSLVLRARRQLAYLLFKQSLYREARDEYRAALAAAEGNEFLRNDREDYLRGLAQSEFNLGNIDEAMRVFQDAVEEAIAAYGKDNPRTFQELEAYADYALDAGRIADAAARYAAADAGYRKRADTPPLALAKLEGGVGVHLALAHHKVHEAETLARRSLAAVRAVPGSGPQDREWIEESLADCLIEQRRWHEALDAAEAALADARAAEERAEYVALMQLPRARALHELGRHAEAAAAAREARDVLSRIPGQLSANKEVATLLRRIERPSRRPRK